MLWVARSATTRSDPNAVISSIEDNSPYRAGPLAIDTPRMPSINPMKRLDAETKRSWCQMRQRDLREGKPPLGEIDPKQITISNALCLEWFSLPSFGSIYD